ncbi:MAG: radical SAM protein [Planctomycetes bacterium]|nr:radical SAM protein [Planctomycetota bacterium]
MIGLSQRILPSLVGMARRPPYLIFHTTNVCNLQCPYCFLLDDLNRKQNELTLDEIERIAAGYGPMMVLMLTGGEPFARKDFAQIPGIFYRHTKPRVISVVTNGTLGDRVAKGVERIVEECPRAQITLTFSLDGWGSEHDRTRGAGSFEKTRSTIRALNELKARVHNLRTGVNVTVLPEMDVEAATTLSSRLSALGVDSLSHNLVRGSTRDNAPEGVDLGAYRILGDLFAAFNRRSSSSADARRTIGWLAQRKDELQRKIIEDTYRERRFQGVTCNAGRDIGVLYSNGIVKPCELLNDSFGNIRDADYDFTRLWRSAEKKQSVRRIRRGKCFCTHECFMSSSIALSPQHLLRAIWYRSCSTPVEEGHPSPGHRKPAVETGSALDTSSVPTPENTLSSDIKTGSEVGAR